MSGTWKEYKGTESILWMSCPDDIKAGLKDENGAAKDGAAKDYQGYHYVVKKVNRKSDGQQFVFVERKALGAAPQPTSNTNSDFEKRQQDIAQAHKENIEASKAQIAAINAHSAIIAVLNDHLETYLKAKSARDEKLVELLEAMIKLMPLFASAAKILEKAQ